MNVLITGGAGFIGSNLVKYFLEPGLPSSPGKIIVLDALTYSGSRENLAVAASGYSVNSNQPVRWGWAAVAFIFMFLLGAIVIYSPPDLADRSVAASNPRWRPAVVLRRLRRATGLDRARHAVRAR